MANVEDFSNDCYDKAFDKAAGLSQYSIRTCPNSTLMDNLTWRQHNIASWLLFLSCDRCKVTWAICHDCPRNSLHFHSRDCILRHSRKHHNDQHEAMKKSKLCFEEASDPFFIGHNDLIEYNSSGNVDDHGSDNIFTICIRVNHKT
jgi:hypothetical protein